MAADEQPGLVEFLRARLDEDWRDAQEDHTLGCGVRDPDLFDADFNLPDFGESWREHCDCRTRKRLLDIEAKRRLVDLHGAEPHECVAWDEALGVPCTCYEVDCPTLCLLALPYASHPDYREEWKP